MPSTLTSRSSHPRKETDLPKKASASTVRNLGTWHVDVPLGPNKDFLLDLNQGSNPSIT